jgi:ADP-heptose:LPS heptosyltransferase
MVDLADELLTMADTVAVICGMDLVISVDTAAIHLAGALGRTAWLLLPYRYEWRWGLEGNSNAWYDSVRVLRQHRAGAWLELLDRVDQALQDLKNTKVVAR